ncbi:MAG: transposase [Gammaproteobacteria bacterium]
MEADARRIMLGAVRLDEHLKAMGILWPFTVAGLLAEQDWAPFLGKLSPNGRPSYAPWAMVGLVVAGILKGVNTLRGLEELARSDLAVMWVTGGICPDHSVIGRFVLLHAETLSESFFAGLTASVLKATGSEVAMLGLDGTVIAAAVARLGTLKAEALAAALAEAEAAAAEASEAGTEKAKTAEAKAAAQVEKLAAAQAVLAERIAARTDKGKDAKGLSIHPYEPEAVVQPQKDKRTYAPSYKPVVLANGARVVVAGDVHPSCETAPVERLVDQARAHGKVETVLADSGFNGAGTIEVAAERDIELLAPEGRALPGETATHKQSDKQIPKGEFRYEAASDSYRCPAGHSLRRLAAKGEYTVYGGAPCADCPMRARCARGAEGRQIKRYPCDAAKEAMRATLATPDGRARYNKRAGMVEPVFAHLKENQGLRRFRRCGLAKVRLELMLHLAAYNLSRAVALARASGGLFGGLLAAALRCLAIWRIWRSAPLTPLHRALTALATPTSGAAHV